MAAERKGDYLIGYGRPPRHKQFQKGISGNPRGRRPGATNLATVLKTAVAETVTIKVNGQRRAISKLEAATKQLVNKAATGDARAMQILIGMLQWYDRRKEPSDEEPRMAQADLQVAASIVARLGLRREES